MKALIGYFILVYCDLLLYSFTTSTPMEYEYRIKEEVPLGTIVGNLVDDVLVRQIELGLLKSSVTVGQKPSHLRSLFTFKILNNADRGVNCFEVKPDGNLVTTRRVDREQLCANRPTTSSNDVYGVLGHLGDPLLLQSAGNTNKFRDSDSQFCPITLHCAVQSTEHISANSQSDQHPISAKPDAKHSLIQIRVQVEDINDNPPYWPGHLQRFQVHFRDGDPIGERRTLPPALDNDVGVNARLRYELFSASSTNDHQIPFSLMENPIDGLYLYAIKQIDREEQAAYQLYLKVTDGLTSSDQVTTLGPEGSSQHSAKLMVDVFIEDINDNAPVFVQPIFTPQHPIPETAPVGKTVLVLNATDADADLNGAFHFGFSREHAWLPAERLAREYFEVRPNGHVVVRRPLNVDRSLDRWDVRSGPESLLDLSHSVSTSSLSSSPGLGNEMQFRFRVVVEDEAVRPYTKSSEATVVIVVRDENDEAPVIQVKPHLPGTLAHSIPMGLRLESGRLGYLIVEENQPPGAKVATVQVYDPDFDGTDSVECRLRTVNFTLSRNADTIESGSSSSASGLIVYSLHTAVELDRETTPSQHIPIICSDVAGHYAEKNVTIYVTDVNDNRPQFVQAEFVFEVEENSPPGTPLRRVTTGQTSSVSTSSSTSKSQMATEQSLRTGMWNLLATDQDSGLNAEIHYFLLENGLNSTGFKVDPVTGAITSAVVFDRERTDQYVMQALAVDRGSPRLTGSVAVKVKILDVNDNPPQFIRSEYSFHVAENQPRSTQIGQISATDLDSEIHGPITYFLSTDRDALVFYLDRDTGVVRSRQPLDREEQARYVFRVMARDGNPAARMTGSRSSDRQIPAGAVQLTGTATITVIVDDVNDNWPVFISPNATANTLAIAVDETLGHKLAYIQAEDADQDENGLISYHIRSGNNQRLFGLDSATGLLYLAGNLGQTTTGLPTDDFSGKNDSSDLVNFSAQFYKPSFHVLTLEACDHGQNPKPHCTLFSNLKIIIKNPKDEGFDVYAKRGHISAAVDPLGTKEVNILGPASTGNDVRVNQPESLLYGDQTSVENNQNFGRTRHNASEIVIICLAIVFTVVLIATLLLICLLRKRSTNYLAQKRIRTENSLDPREHDWNVTCSSTQLGVETKPGSEPEPEALESQINVQIPEAKLHDHELTTYPKPAESPNSVPASLSKDPYHLLTRTVDTRRRNLPRELSTQEPLIDARFALPNGDGRFPTVAGAGRVQFRAHMNKLPRTNEYQTLDYLGLVSSAFPQRYPPLYMTQRRLTYSPLGPTQMRMYHGALLAGIRPPKSDSFLLTHTNQFAGSRTKSPIPDYKSSDTNYQVVHSHSRSQPQPMDRHSVPYPFVGPSSLPGNIQTNLAPLINRPIRPGIQSLQQATAYQSIMNSSANMNGSNGCGSATLYGSHTNAYPIQSHTYYDIRQSDQTDSMNLMPKSKSQQISRHDSKPSPLNSNITDDELSAEHLSNDTGEINAVSVGNVQSNDPILKNGNDRACWRELCTDQKNTEWTTSSKQPIISVADNVSRFILSPVDSPKYIAAAYKEASFV